MNIKKSDLVTFEIHHIQDAHFFIKHCFFKRKICRKYSSNTETYLFSFDYIELTRHNESQRVN